MTNPHTQPAPTEPKPVPDAPWIEHDGGPCPVPGETVVDVQFREHGNHRAFIPDTRRRADTFGHWSHEGWSDDIIAYRLAVPDAETCPHCGHAAHEPGKCLNMASDSDCQCGTDAAREVETWGIEDTGDFLWIGPMRRDGQKINEIVARIDIRDFKPEAAAHARLRANQIVQCVNNAGPQSDTIRAVENQRDDYLRRLTQQASELAELRVDHDRLCRAINDSSDNCEEAGCDKHGHTDKCETFSPAAMLKQQQTKLDSAIAQLAEMKAERDRALLSRDAAKHAWEHCQAERDTALADRDAARKELQNAVDVLRKAWSAIDDDEWPETNALVESAIAAIDAALRAALEREG